MLTRRCASYLNLYNYPLAVAELVQYHIVYYSTMCRNSLPCISQISPLNPGRHSHRNPSTRSRHVPPNWHGSSLQSSMFVSHIIPVKPELHMQLNPLTSSTQVPPFRHRSEEQSLMSTSHKSPVKPGGHTHMNPIARSTHVAPLRHGLLAQSSKMDISQKVPVNSGGH